MIYDEFGEELLWRFEAAHGYRVELEQSEKMLFQLWKRTTPPRDAPADLTFFGDEDTPQRTASPLQAPPSSPLQTQPSSPVLAPPSPPTPSRNHSPLSPPTFSPPLAPTTTSVQGRASTSAASTSNRPAGFEGLF
jgi:hypothetical protein